jgi:hypothetical protein
MEITKTGAFEGYAVMGLFILNIGPNHKEVKMYQGWENLAI